MSKTHRPLSDKNSKPREIKRQRQQQAMVQPARSAWHAVFVSEPHAPVWKPLG